MLAVIEKVYHGYVAEFERPINHPPDEVWAALTENGKLSLWMPNLQAEDLRKGGNMKFAMRDGADESFDLRITDYEPHSVLEFEWGKELVRFEVSAQEYGSRLLLKVFIGALTDHVPVDLAGWHICLDRLSALLDGRFTEFSMDEWEKRHEQYSAAVKRLGAQ